MEAESTPGLVVIHVALFRMATASLAAAYQVLGYKTHHGLDDTLGMPWTQLEEAAEATWPHVPDARQRKPFTRSDWDKLWGSEYDIATDMASPFADQLIKAYPNAKVVIVQREFEPWWESYQSECIETLFNPLPQLASRVAWYVLGIRAGYAMRKIHFGFFGVTRRDMLDYAHARKAYDEYFERIRSMVPPERRLEYRMGDGWGPLCAFLGRDIPDVPFPRVNDRKTHNEGETQTVMRIFKRGGVKAAPFVVAAVAFLGWWYKM
ncbi:hypothetical protein F4778DRAFT_211081 [Xylariomycetidae sp. FL2044]|nr:hypothetical protein F4778DRAFT_211081 [Xylariomycetidae sp. FL2044]